MNALSAVVEVYKRILVVSESARRHYILNSQNIWLKIIRVIKQMKRVSMASSDP